MVPKDAEKFLEIEKSKINFGFQKVDSAICSSALHLTVVSFSRKEFRGVQDYLSDSIWKNKRITLVLINSHFEKKIAMQYGLGTTLTCFCVDDEIIQNWAKNNSVGNDEIQVKIF